MQVENRIDLDNIEIGSINESHIPAVLKIHIECGLSPWTHSDYSSEIIRDDSLCKVAKYSGEVIGFSIVRLLKDVTKKSYTSSEIYNIAVNKSFQGKGVGQKIFDEIVLELKSQNVLEVWLDVRESNINALKFYLSNRFEKQFIRKNYYSNSTEDAHILKLVLEQ